MGIRIRYSTRCAGLRYRVWLNSNTDFLMYPLRIGLGATLELIRDTRRIRPLTAFLMVVSAAVTFPGAVRAEDAAQSPPADQLAEINVTARRRVEPLQEVPVAISVMTGAQAEAHNLNDIQDISSEIPTVDFRTGASNKDQDIFIRGIGTITTSPGVEPSVSTVVDGVVYDRPGQATEELLDVDHIEVLRGPQGTLFGKNAAAGVINIVTNEPTADFHGYTDGSWLGGGDEYRVKSGVSGALAPDLTGLVSGVFSHYDGNVDNLFNGSTVNGYERYGGHSKLVYTPDEDWKITFGGDFLHSWETIPTGVPAATGQTAYPTNKVTPNPAFATVLNNTGVVPSYDNTNISTNVNSNARDENGGGSITVDGKLGGGYTLTSITAYRTWLNVQDQDYDQLSQLTSAFPEIEDHGQLRFHQFSEEARIASPKGPFIDYVAGLYYLHAEDDEIYQRSVEQLKADTLVPNSGDSHYGTHDDNYAVFGEGNFNFTDSLRAILGGRLVRDELDYYFQRASTSPVAVPAISPSFASTGSTSNYGYTDRVGLQYDVTKDIMTYATYSHGYTGPAYNVFFNMAASATLALKPETSNSYEVGIKSLFLDHKVELNLAGFITNFENYQANFTDVLDGALVTRLINAGSVSTKGLEADFALRPIDNLTVSGALAWTRARITDFNCPPNAATSCNINGQPLPFAPDFKSNVDGNYLVPLAGSLRLVLDTDYKWQSKVQYQLTETPDTIQGGYGIWDASVGIDDSASHWRVSALVKNIADTHYSSYLAHGDLAGVMRWVPRDNDRYAGIEAQKSF
jgi:iron complex outermembrane recepter protein